MMSTTEKIMRMFCPQKKLLTFCLVVLLSILPKQGLLQTLNDNCTINILNGSAQIDQTGTFALRTPIPAGVPYRARAICVENDQITYGESALVIGVANGITDIGEIDFSGPLHPIPVSLTLSSIRTELTLDQASTQISVTGLFPDGTTGPLTVEEFGTIYRSSDSEVATVDDSGFVTGLKNGQVIISVRNEGALASIEIDVLFPEDADGDGMSDSFEIANGLDPNDPSDAEQDLDNDGLTNLEEFLLGTSPMFADTDGDNISDSAEFEIGTDPTNPDTDGDGLVDGEELLRGTDPLNADTDGDGISDGVEVQLGLDPITFTATTTLIGQIVDEAGLAVEAANVSVLNRFSDLSDSNGNFQIENVPAVAGNLSVLARIIREGQVLDGVSAAVAPVAGGLTDYGTVTVAVVVGRLTGSVFSPRGELVAGARITAEVSDGGDDRFTNADLIGQYTLDALPSGDTRVIAQDSQTGLFGFSEINVDAEGSQQLDIELSALGTIRGIALERDGNTPVGPGVDIQLRGLGINYTDQTQTNAFGEYVFEFVPLGEYRVDSIGPNGERGRTTTVLSGTTQILDADVLYLGRGTVTGFVETASGTRLSNLNVELQSFSIFSETLNETTNSLGEFTFNNVFVGDFTLFTQDPVRGVTGQLRDMIDIDGDLADVVITMQPTGSLVGQVFQSDGLTAATDTTVELLQNNRLTGQSTQTDALGNYAFDFVALGSYGVRARTSDGNLGLSSANLATVDEQVSSDIILNGLGAVNVTVVDASGSTVADVQVTINTGQPFNQTYRATTDSSGTVLLDNVLAGSLSIGVFDPIDRLGGMLDSNLFADETIDITVSLEPAGDLFGVVTLADGVTPAANITLTASPGGARVTTAADGRYRFNMLPVANNPYRIRLRDSSNVLRAQVDDLNLSLDTALERDIVLAGNGSVSGLVFNPGGTVSAGAIVVLDSNVSGAQDRSVVTSSDGRYSFSGVPEGNFTVEASIVASRFAGEESSEIEFDSDAKVVDITLEENQFPSNIQTIANLFDANNFSYPVQRDGSVQDGSRNVFRGDGDVFRGEGRLDIFRDGELFPFVNLDQGNISFEQGGREAVITTMNGSGLEISRSVYVPLDGYFVRHVETLNNTTAESITVDVRVDSHYRIANYVRTDANGTRRNVRVPVGVISTSSGDSFLNVDAGIADQWAVLDDDRDQDPFVNNNVPAVAHAFDGLGGQIRVGEVEFLSGSTGQFNRMRTTWLGITIASGESVSVMHFTAEQTSRGAATVAAQRLVDLPPESIEGLSQVERDTIANFNVPTTGVSGLSELPSLLTSIDGTVFETDTTTSVANSEVSYQSDHALFQRTFTTNTNQSGQYSFVGRLSNGNSLPIPAGSFSVAAEHPQSSVDSPSVAGDTTGGSDTQNIVFSNTGAVSGTVRRFDGVVASFGTIELMGENLPRTLILGIPEDGQYIFRGLPVGNYTLVATLPNPDGTGIAGTVTAQIEAGIEIVRDITLVEVGGVTGQVLTAGNVPVSGLLVTLEGGEFGRTTITDTGGFYRFLDAPVDLYTVTVEDPVTGQDISASVEVIDQTLITQDLILTATATILLDATFEDGSPARGALVQIQSDIVGPNFRSAGTVRTDGSAIISDVPLGPFVLRVVNQNNTSVSTSINGEVSLHGQEIPLVAVVPIDFPPIVSLLSPTDGQAIIKGETTLVSVDVNDDFGIRRVEFLRNGVFVSADSVAPYELTLLVDDDLEGQTDIVFSVRVIDDGGNVVEQSATVTALEDNVPPSVTNVSPAEGLVLIEGQSLFYSANVTDNAGVEQVTFLVNGGSIRVDTQSPYGGTFSIPETYADAGDTDLVFEVIGRDFAGNETPVLHTVVVAPDLPPELTVTSSPATGDSFIEGTSFSVSSSANDDIAVNRVELLLDGEVIQTRFNAPYNFNVSVPLLNSVTNPVALIVRATDTQGQQTDSSVVDIVVIQDNPPTVEFLAPAANDSVVEGSLVTLSATASDDVGVERVDFFRDGVEIGSDSTAPYEFTERLASGADGSVVAYLARAVDTLDQKTSTGVNITRLDDLVPPTVAITAPQDGAIITVGPSDVAIVIDTSGSTGSGSGADIDDDGVFDNILKAEIFAAKQLLDFLNPETTNVAVVDFSSSAILVQSLTNDFEAVNTALDQILASGPGGGTNFSAAMNVATTELAGLNSRSSATPVQLFLSDGSASVPTAQIARASDGAIIVNSFAVGSGANISALQQISDGTGGVATPVPDASQIVDILPSIVLFGIDTLVSIADAQDDIAVRDVSFTVTSDDGLISDTGSDDSAPYTQASGLPIIEDQLAITINATANDFGDNIANANPVSVTLLPAENNPQLNRVEPEFAISGQLVTVRGQFLVSPDSSEPSDADPNVPATTVVFYNGVEITPDFVDKITIRFLLPAGAASGEVFAVANGVQTNSLIVSIDDDQDGLTNEEEVALGTDPLVADTDGDGLNDGDEVNVHGTDPLAVDTDGDGLSDGFEITNGLDPNDSSDATADADGDGLSNTEEFNLGTGINDPDSDNDGVNDGDEVNVHSTDPLDTDTDNDGLQDGLEINTLNSNPLSTDSDGDGMDDRFEFDNGLNLIDASDRDTDADGDGLSNFDEFTLNTGVNNPDSDGDGLSDGEEVNNIGSDPLDTDTDNDGLDDGVDDDPVVADATVPTVTLLEPVAGTSIVRGSVINLAADAADNGRVTEVNFLADSISVGTDISEPYGINGYRAPLTGVDLTIEVQAEDTNSNIGTTTAISFTLVDDPNTTVFGRVIDQASQPVMGAAVEVAGLTAVTLADGSFSIANVPTVEAILRVSAELAPLVGLSAEVVPVRAGVTDVGAIILREQIARSGAVGYYSLTSNQGVAAQLEPIEAAGLDPVLLTNLATDDLDSLSVLFIQNPSNSSGYASTYTNNLPRIFDFIETGGVVVFHDRATSPNTSSVVPGDPATFVRSVVGGTQIITSDDDFLNGPGGMLNASVVADNSFGSHGYAQQNSLPVGSIGLLSQSDTSRWHTFAVPHGTGYMVYSSIPLDFYLNRIEPVRSIYAPNILSYASQLVPDFFDIDGDGLSDEDEVNIYGTDMLNPDTDGDGLPDGVEVESGLDPLDPADAALDLDGDGLSNIDEFTLGTLINGADSDNDGLSDGDEVNVHSTDPLNPDTDGDGLNDGFEVDNGFNPLLPGEGELDTDGDGLSNADEVALGLDPLNPDTDGDGITDGYEVNFGLDPLADDADLDLDGDGLTNLEEFALGTNPFSGDSDFDGLGDADEVNIHGTDPANADTDGDGLNDGVELNNFGTDPLNADSDGDGLGDGFEVNNGFDPLAPGEETLDTDGDGLTNLEEFNLGTNPRRADTDFDGLNDNVEVNVTLTDPTNSDTDGDGLGDGFEVNTSGTDPLVADTDGDGMDDRFEFNNGLNPNDASDRNTDADGDGLSNFEEFELGTNVQSADTDNDGLNDFDEINVHNTDPLNSDTDGGGDPDGFEIDNGTDPLDPSDDVSVFLPFTLNDASDFRWDIQSDGNISDGTNDAYDGGLRLSVNNNTFNSFSTALTEDAQRELIIGNETINNLVVTRKIYVPTDGTFARFLEVIENPTNTDVAATVLIRSNFGSDGSTQTVSTSSGDTVLDTTDTNVVTDDSSDGGGDPSLFHMWGSNSSTLLADTVSLSGDNLNVQYTNVNVPANGRILLMHVASQNANRAIATTNLLDMQVLPAVLTAGMNLDELEAVINFTLAPDGDGDGLSDLREALVGTDPALPDTDGDGLLDGFEFDNGLDPLVADDTSIDVDGDGLDLLEEQAEGTDPSNPDSDGDGLSDGDEVNVHGTDPLDADSDGDGLSDGFEVDNGFDPLQPGEGDLDSDGDGLTNSQEGALGTDPLNPDTDSDGMPDGYEFNNGLDPLANDASFDFDGDDLTNAEEFAAGTDPSRFDSDFDGLGDGDEVNNIGTDPLNDDTDGDGLPDGDEVFGFNTDPLSSDSDGDGMSDGFEVGNGLDPNDQADASLDLDGDGLSNLDEFNLGTNPSLVDSDEDGIDDGEEVNVTLTDPANPDTDGDGLLDGFELDNGFDPLIGGEENQDPDGDGVTNLQEQEQGSDPNLADTDGDGVDDLADVAPTDPTITSADIMVVDDIVGGRPIFEEFGATIQNHSVSPSSDSHVDAINAIGLDATTWNVEEYGLPSRLLMSKHQLVVWVGGERGGLSNREEVFVQNYLNGGGCYFLSAQDYSSASGFTPFMQDFLGLQDIFQDNLNLIFGDFGVEIELDGVGPLYPVSQFYSGQFNMRASPDELIAGLASPLLSGGFSEEGPQVAATYYDSTTFGAAFLGFPLEVIQPDADRGDILQRVYDACSYPHDLSVPGDPLPPEEPIDPRPPFEPPPLG